MPMWSKPERATGGSYFAAFATHGIPRNNYKRIARPATQIECKSLVGLAKYMRLHEFDGGNNWLIFGCSFLRFKINCNLSIKNPIFVILKNRTQ